MSNYDIYMSVPQGSNMCSFQRPESSSILYRENLPAETNS